MAEFVYVDNSNVFIEGKMVSAVVRGYALNIWDALENRILDNDYRLDFGKLHTLLLAMIHPRLSVLYCLALGLHRTIRSGRLLNVAALRLLLKIAIYLIVKRKLILALLLQ